MDSSREIDIQKLCKAVLEGLSPCHDHNRGTIYCPFCSEDGGYNDEVSEIKHSSDCAYLIAKDLSTNGGQDKSTAPNKK